MGKVSQVQLWMAAGQGDIAGVEAALSKGASAGEPDPHNARYTALHLAAANGHVTVVRALLAQGVPADIRSQHGACPSHLAAEEGHANVLEVLAAAGADLDKTAAPGCAWTPLYFAAAQGRLEAAQFLIARGVRVMLSDESGLSPLDIAERFRVRPKDMSAEHDARKLPEPNLQREALVQLLEEASGRRARDIFEQSGVTEGRDECHDDIDGDPEAPPIGKNYAKEMDEARTAIHRRMGAMKPSVEETIEKEVAESIKELALDSPQPMVLKAKSSKLPGGESHRLDIATLEGENIALEVSEKGFLVESRSLDTDDMGSYFESLHPFLLRASEGYKKRFHGDLTRRLEAEVAARATAASST